MCSACRPSGSMRTSSIRRPTTPAGLRLLRAAACPRAWSRPRCPCAGARWPSRRHRRRGSGQSASGCRCSVRHRGSWLGSGHGASMGGPDRHQHRSALTVWSTRRCLGWPTHCGGAPQVRARACRHAAWSGCCLEKSGAGATLFKSALPRGAVERNCSTMRNPQPCRLGLARAPDISRSACRARPENRSSR